MMDGCDVKKYVPGTYGGCSREESFGQPPFIDPFMKLEGSFMSCKELHILKVSNDSMLTQAKIPLKNFQFLLI